MSKIVTTECSDICGWLSAIFAALTYGSFGVPIKATADVDVHPLILQSYKTFVVFLTCWLVFLVEHDFRWTPYGLLSGLLWVVGGTGGIYGIRNAGMAIAVGTWASIMVLMNFVWGILIFREPIHSLYGACFAFSLLTVGLIGMSKYSAAPQKPEYESRKEVELVGEDRPSGDTDRLKTRKFQRTQSDEEVESLIPLEEESRKNIEAKPVIIGGRLALTKREAGILFSAWNGVFSGSALIPLHYAKKQGFSGLSYIFSYGTGSFLANIIVLIVFFFYTYSQHPSLKKAWESMPAWHFKKLWLRGSLSGLLMAAGMFGSIQATATLGQGVGNSLVQSKILVSGLWGIYWFKEIKERKAIMRWFISACVGVSGILWLSYERLAAKKSGVEH